MLVKGVGSSGGLTVDAAVRSRDHQDAVVAQQSSDLFQHLLVVAQMLDDLERDNCTERTLLVCGQIKRRAELELQIGSRVVESAVLDGHLVDVNAEDVLGRFGEDCGPETLAASEIKNPTAPNQSRRPEVSMEMLVYNLDIGRPRHAALASPIDQARCSSST